MVVVLVAKGFEILVDVLEEEICSKPFVLLKSTVVQVRLLQEDEEIIPGGKN